MIPCERLLVKAPTPVFVLWVVTWSWRSWRDCLGVAHARESQVLVLRRLGPTIENDGARIRVGVVRRASLLCSCRSMGW